MDCYDCDFTYPKTDLKQWLQSMFLGNWPLSVWGLVSQIETGYYKALCVDMKTGNSIDFEITDNMMRIYYEPNNDINERLAKAGITPLGIYNTVE